MKAFGKGISGELTGGCVRVVRWLGAAVMAACLTVAPAPAWSQAAGGKPFVMAADADPNSLAFQWARLISDFLIPAHFALALTFDPTRENRSADLRFPDGRS